MFGEHWSYQNEGGNNSENIFCKLHSRDLSDKIPLYCTFLL